MALNNLFREAKAVGHAEFRISRVRKFFGKYKFTLVRGGQRAKISMNKKAIEHFFPHIDKVKTLRGNSIRVALVAKNLEVKKATNDDNYNQNDSHYDKKAA